MTPPWWLEAMRQHNYTNGHTRDEVAALLALVEALGTFVEDLAATTGDTDKMYWAGRAREALARYAAGPGAP